MGNLIWGKPTTCTTTIDARTESSGFVVSKMCSDAYPKAKYTRAYPALAL